MIRKLIFVAVATVASAALGADCKSDVARQQRVGIDLLDNGMPARGDISREQRALASGDATTARDYVATQSALWNFNLETDADAGTRAHAWLIYVCIAQIPTERIYREAERMAKQCSQAPADTLDRAMQCFMKAAQTVEHVPAVQPLARRIPSFLKATTVGLPSPFHFVFDDLEFLGAVKELTVDDDADTGRGVTYSFDAQGRLVTTDSRGRYPYRLEHAYDTNGYEVTKDGPSLLRVGESETAVRYGRQAVVLDGNGRVSHWGYLGEDGRFRRDTLFRYSGDRLIGMVMPELGSLCVPGPCPDEEFSIAEAKSGADVIVTVTSSRRHDYNSTSTYRNGRVVSERRTIVYPGGSQIKKAEALCTFAYVDDTRGNWVERTETCDQVNLKRTTKRSFKYF